MFPDRVPLHFHPVARLAHGADDVELGMEVVEGDGHGFRHAGGFGDGDPRPLLPLLHHFHGHGGARREAVAQGAYLRVQIGKREETDIDGGHGEELRDLPLFEHFEDPVHVEGGEKLKAARAQDRRVHDVELAEHVVEGQKAQGEVVLGGALVVGDAVAREVRVLVGEHGPFGHACRAPGVEDRGNIPAVPVDGKEESVPFSFRQSRSRSPPGQITFSTHPAFLRRSSSASFAPMVMTKRGRPWVMRFESSSPVKRLERVTAEAPALMMPK